MTRFVIQTSGQTVNEGDQSFHDVRIEMERYLPEKQNTDECDRLAHQMPYEPDKSE